MLNRWRKASCLIVFTRGQGVSFGGFRGRRTPAFAAFDQTCVGTLPTVGAMHSRTLSPRRYSGRATLHSSPRQTAEALMMPSLAAFRSSAFRVRQGSAF